LQHLNAVIGVILRDDMSQLRPRAIQFDEQWSFVKKKPSRGKEHLLR
jgi:hypothetical protein